ncbi:uncharacterized protein LOC131614483 [Vicia villosa]|uniref:uncharacterized protein LOC131614483 n=1 Tax=Vicia villosa TaxID=3911 RepID=UPI00273AB137|nr:uncharacterized protein LOC131614483 [Vicia villosa]
MSNRLHLKASIDIVCWLTLQACALRGHDEISNSRNQDEARDESKKEQLALVLRFVDKVGLIQDSFFDAAHVKDTTSLTLKEAICDILSRHNLDVYNIRGQGYDVNVVCSSTKRHYELQASQLEEIAHLLEIGEIFKKKIAKERGNYATRGDAYSSYNYLKAFDFIFILHLMKELMGITYMLCQALQKQNQDVVNAMDLVRSTKSFIQDLRENGWDILFSTVTSFCEKHGIEIPDLNDIHLATRFGRSRREENQVTIQHYSKVEIFFTTIDKQLQELNSKFSERAMDLLTLSCALSPKDEYKAFNIDTICSLVEKYYPIDFRDQEKNKTRQVEIYFLIDRLLRLITTLPISTATTERSFSAMKIIKTKLRNKMDVGFLRDSMTV